MAYQDSIAHSAIANAAHGAFAAVARALGHLGNALMVASEANSRLDRVHKLHGMTDAELAKLGIDRDQIVHHVFRDIYFI